MGLAGRPRDRDAGARFHRRERESALDHSPGLPSGGDALAFYTDAGGGQVRRFRGGAWGDAIPLPVLAEAVGAAAVAPDGTGTFSWATAGDPSTSTTTMVDSLNLARLSPAGAWSETMVVGDGGIGWWQEASPPVPVIALDPSGSTFVAWSRIDQQVEQWPSAIWSVRSAPTVS
jgi:hypothetical protein